ncbi:glycosyltransferase [archaeon]|nr:glycosyltransferase [Nanoarchaeota archaeon]MCG2723807.1 glycosyltransferase [archaeon]
MWSDNVTVCLLCRNEEKRIENAIRNFKDKFKILVIDDIPPSTDRTHEICKKLCVEYTNVNRGNRAEQPDLMNKFWKKVKTEYMLFAACGEYIPDELLQLYAKVANEKSYDVVRAWRISITAGKHLLVWGDARKFTKRTKGIGHLRFMRRGSIDYKGNIIHREGKMVNPEKSLAPSIDPHLMFYQFRDYDSSWTEIKHAGYNDINAIQLYEKGEKYSLFKMLYKSIGAFFVCYFVRGAWKQGHLGFMHSYYRFTHYMGLYLRLWDIEHNLQKKDIEKIHNDLRSKLISKEITVDDLLKY